MQASNRLKRYEELEGYGFETDLRGVPIARAPLGELQQLVSEGQITAAQKSQMEAPLREFIENHIRGPRLGMILDSGTYTSANEAGTPSIVKQWDIDLLKGSTDSLKDIHDSIQRVNNEIARVLGVEGLLLGGQGRGSMALSQDKSNNFFLVVDGALNELAASFTRDFINPLWILNGWDDELKPKFKTDSIQLRDVETITNAMKDMAQAGAILAPDDPAINEVRDLLGLSRAPEIDEEALERDASLNLDDKKPANPKNTPKVEDK